MREPKIWRSADEVKSDSDEHLRNAREIRSEIVAVADKRTLVNTIEPLNDIFIEIDRVLPLSELMANVHPSMEIRDAAEKCQQNALKLLSEIQLDREIFDAVSSVDLAGVDPETDRFVRLELREYRRSGVHKDESARKRLAELRERMVEAGQEFSRNVREGRLSILVDESDLEGLPEDYLKRHKPCDDGKIEITTDYPDFFPFATYAEREDARKALYMEFLNRAYPRNEKVLKTILGMRHEYAEILGFSNWAAYNAEDKMLKEERLVSDFIGKVAGIARPRMEREMAELSDLKKKRPHSDGKVREWDRFYLVNKLRSERYGVNARDVRSYFDFTKVKEGLLKINQELFDVEFRRVEDAPVWHDSVEVYDVVDSGETFGRFYLDMHPRDGKYGHAAMFHIQTGVEGRQLPMASLVCNFPEPTGGGPALMEHGDVVTFFHEFGHLMHHLMSGRHKWISLSGISCEWDFVEAPSQLMEEWAWSHDILKRFAVHFETGETIPEELVARMKKAEEIGKGVHVMRQLFLAGLALVYHNRNPLKIDLLDLFKEMNEKYSPYPYEEGTHMFANFEHLEGYSSLYYTYMWSLVLAKDIFTEFERSGLMNRETAASYRKAVIEPGGSADAEEMLRIFLGRSYDFAAFERWLAK